MTDTEQNPTLGEASGSYLSELPPEERVPGQQEVLKFVRWFGRERPFASLTAAEAESYAEQLSMSDKDYLKKLELIKQFLSYARKKNWSKINLSAHLKARKGKTKQRPVSKKEAQEAVILTKQGQTDLKAELAALKDERHVVIAEMRKAAADKDFRENAPLHAARERRGHIEGRIMELESILKAAVVIDDKQQGPGLKVGIGDSVVLCPLDSGEESCYTVVPPKEVDVIRGKISSASPVGQAVLGKEQGQIVEIQAPAGKLSYRIVRIER